MGIPQLSRAVSCNIISLDTLRHRAARHINWTHVMTSAPQGQSELAYLLGPNNTKSLVMCRDYGDITSIMLDDAVIDETTVLKIPTKHYAEFLELFSKTLMLEDLKSHYNALDLYLASMNQPVLGPLTSARVVLNMVRDKSTPAAALQLANDERMTLVKRQVDRLKYVNASIDAG